jgi:hypothetical protein
VQGFLRPGGVQRRRAGLGQHGEGSGHQPTDSSSTSKTSVALGGITPPAPRAP